MWNRLVLSLTGAHLPNLDQSWASYSPWAKPGPPSVFVNKVLLAYSQARVFTCCLGCFHTMVAESSGFDRHHMAHEIYIFTLWPVKFADP